MVSRLGYERWRGSKRRQTKPGLERNRITMQGQRGKPAVAHLPLNYIENKIKSPPTGQECPGHLSNEWVIASSEKLHSGQYSKLSGETDTFFEVGTLQMTQIH